MCWVRKKGNTDIISHHRVINTNQSDENQVNVFNSICDSARTDNFASAREREVIDDFPALRKHTDFEKLTLQNVEDAYPPVDKVSTFSLRPFKLRKTFPQIRQYYRFFKYI